MLYKVFIFHISQTLWLDIDCFMLIYYKLYMFYDNQYVIL